VFPLPPKHPDSEEKMKVADFGAADCPRYKKNNVPLPRNLQQSRAAEWHFCKDAAILYGKKCATALI